MNEWTVLNGTVMIHYPRHGQTILSFECWINMLFEKCVSVMLKKKVTVTYWRKSVQKLLIKILIFVAFDHDY